MGLPWWDYWLPVALALKGRNRRIAAIEKPAATTWCILGLIHGR